MIICRGTCVLRSVGMSFMKWRFWPNTWIDWKCEPGQRRSESRGSTEAHRQQPQSTWVETRYFRMLETGGVPEENISSWNRIGAGGFETGSKQAKSAIVTDLTANVPVFRSLVMWLLFLLLLVPPGDSSIAQRREVKVWGIHISVESVCCLGHQRAHQSKSPISHLWKILHTRTFDQANVRAWFGVGLNGSCLPSFPVVHQKLYYVLKCWSPVSGPHKWMWGSQK